MFFQKNPKFCTFGEILLFQSHSSQKLVIRKIQTQIRLFRHFVAHGHYSEIINCQKGVKKFTVLSG